MYVNRQLNVEILLSKSIPINGRILQMRNTTTTIISMLANFNSFFSCVDMVDCRLLDLLKGILTDQKFKCDYGPKYAQNRLSTQAKLFFTISLECYHKRIFIYCTHTNSAPGYYFLSRLFTIDNTHWRRSGIKSTSDSSGI